MNNISLLSDDIRSEFSIDEQGRAFASRRAIARLAGVETSSVTRLLDTISGVALPKDSIFEPIAGQRFEGVALIPDIVASLIIEYYGYECQERYRTLQAKKVCRAFRAIGFRVWLQNELGWEPQKLEIASAPIPALNPAAIPVLTPDMNLSMLTQSIQALSCLATHVQAQAAQLQQQQQQINQLVAIQQQAEEELKALPIAELPAPEKPIRAKVNEIVRNYVTRKKVSHQSAWSKLYRELYYRCHIDVDARTRKGGTKLDVVEEAGYMEQLHAIASEIFV